MKLFSTNRNSKGNQLKCDDAVFDPNLMTIVSIDEDEKVIGFRYDFEECGHPLNLPFKAYDVEFWIKLTVHDIHICSIVYVDDVSDEYEDYIGDLGEIEFDVRMTTEEKSALLLILLKELLCTAKAKPKNQGGGDTKSAISGGDSNNSSLGKDATMNAVKDLFPGIFVNKK